MRFYQIIISMVLFLAICLMGGCQYNKCYYCEVIEKKEMEKEEQKQITPEELAKIAQTRQKRLEELRSELKLTPLFEKWHHDLNQENVRNLHLCQDILFVETESNRLFAFDRREGMPFWIYTVGSPIDFHPEIYGDKVYLVSMGMLHILHKKTGEPTVKGKKELSFAPCSPLCPTDTYLYVGGLDNFVYALDMETGDKVWRHRIDGYTQGRPVKFKEAVYVAGTDNRLYAIDAQTGHRYNVGSGERGRLKKWGIEGYYTTRGANVGAVASLEKLDRLYVGSRDYNLYCIDRLDGTLRWKFECGGAITEDVQTLEDHGQVRQDVQPLEDSVYVVADTPLDQDSVLYRINGATGELKAMVKHGKKVFFTGRIAIVLRDGKEVKDKYDWILRRDKKVAMVTEAGEVKNIFDLAAFDFFASNVDVDMDRFGYLASSDGFIFAVEERAILE